MKALNVLLLLLVCLGVLASCSDPKEGGPLDAPTRVTATSGLGYILVTWTDNSTTEEGFKIFRRVEADETFPDEPLAQVDANITEYKDTDISSAESYVYAVQAFSDTDDGDLSVLTTPAKATQAEGKVTVVVNFDGAGGQGVVTSDPQGIDCIQRSEVSSQCSFDFDRGTAVTLTATPDPGSQFTGWSDACTGTECTLNLDANKTVTATFVPISNKLLVTKIGDGTGLVTSDTTDAFKIDCGTKCEATSEVETKYGLRAVANPGSVFAGFTNCDAITNSGRCSVTIGNGKGSEIIAEFLRDVGDPTIDLRVEPTTLAPTATSVKLSWTIDDKGSSEPTTLELSDNASGVTSPSLSGKKLTDFVDVSIPEGVTSVTFTLRATNFFSPDGVTDSVTVTRGSLPAVNGFKAVPDNIVAGSSVTLSWDAPAAGTTLELEKDPATGDTTKQAVTGTSKVETPANTTTYTLIAKNSFGETRSNAVPVTVRQRILPTVTLNTPSPTSLPSTGGKVTLNWSDTNATSLTLERSVGASVNVLAETDNAITLDQTATTTYKLVATNEFGSVESVSRTVTVADAPPPAPVVSFTTATTEDTTFALGAEVDLNWQIQNTPLTSLTLNSEALAVSALSETVTLPDAARTTTYTLAATNGGGTDNDILSLITADRPEIGEVIVTEDSATGSYTATFSPDREGRGDPSDYTYTLVDPISNTIPIDVVPSAGSDSYTFVFTPTDNAGTYTLSATNEYGAAPGEASVADIATFEIVEPTP